MTTIITRFAPSPTGFLHLGHAYAALFAWTRARQRGGRFLLRLEDIDRTRCKPAFADAIIEDLTWLGLDWDGPVRVQSEHMPQYGETLGRLDRLGLLYPCFCTRADILREVAEAAAAPHDPDGVPLYPGSCRRLSPADREARISRGTPFALRLDVMRAVAVIGSALSFQEIGEGTVPCHPERFGDVVLARKDTPASYHLCVTHDDWWQGVTLVTRGIDLRPATDLQRLLQALMGWPAPSYAHHGLLVNDAGRRLAKRDRAVTLRSLRAAGHSAAEVRGLAGYPA